MRNLLRSRRGSAAFAVVIALVPLIGVMALGGEAGSWYVTRQHAQDAADSAAYSGALKRACELANNGNCITDTQTVAYRGKEFAAQSAFCNAGDSTAYPGRACSATLPAGTSQAVAIDVGNYAAPTWTTAANGAFVRATVSQQQPAYLAKILGLTTVNVGAQAIAKVGNGAVANPCVLALTGQISFQGSPNIISPNCGLASNDTANNALNFTGGGMTINVGSLLAAGGCSGAASFCNAATTHTYSPQLTNPFAPLDSALTSLCGANPTLPATCGLSTTGACKPGSTLVAYTAATPCANSGITTKGNAAVTLAAGVYFISGTLTLKGGSQICSISCAVPAPGVTLILLPGASFDTKGGGTITVIGPTTAPTAASLPAAFQPDASLFKGMSIYDASATAVQFGGNSNINLTGNIYAPTADVTFQGNPSITFGAGACGELIAKSVAFNGNATLSTAGCTSAGIPTPVAQYVQLVQ